MSRLQELEAAVSPRVIEDAIEVGELLAELQVPHALVGGLAVGLNGFPRATKHFATRAAEDAPVGEPR